MMWSIYFRDKYLFKIRDSQDGSMRINTSIGTDSTSVSTSKSDVTVFSPAGSPRVLDLPSSTYNTNQKNSMINWVTTVIENTWAVVWPVSSINSDTQWSWGNSTFQSSASSHWWNRCDLEITSLFLTGLSFGLVWILRFSWQSMVFDVFESTWWPSTIASVVSVTGRAIDQLLLGKWDSLLFKQSPWLGYACGTESPAWSALTLILDSGNGTLCGPVNFNVWSFVVFFLHLGLRMSRGNVWKESSSELLISENRKLIDSHFVSLSWISIMSSNLLKVCFEDQPSIDFFFWLERSSESCLPLFERIRFNRLLVEIEVTNRSQSENAGQNQRFIHLERDILL